MLNIDERTVFSSIVSILNQMLSEDWDVEAQTPLAEETRLVAELGFNSQDLVILGYHIEEHFQCGTLPFYKLIMTESGRYVDDIRLGELVSFVRSELVNA